MRVKCDNPVCKKITDIPDDASRCHYCGAPYCEYGVSLDSIRAYYKLDSELVDKRKTYYLKHYPLRGLGSFIFLFFPGILVAAMLLNAKYSLCGLLVFVLSIATSIYLVHKNVEWTENNARNKYPSHEHPQGIDP